MPRRISRGLSRNGRRSGGGGAFGCRAGSVGRRTSRTLVVMPRPRGYALLNEGELRLPCDVVTLPRPHERRVARCRVGPHAHVVLAVGLESGAAEERQLVEVGRQPRLRVFLALRLLGALDAAVLHPRELVAPREVVIAH